MNLLTQKQKKDFKSYKKESILIKPTINIGKNGITNQLIEEIKFQLKVKKLIKIKIINQINDKKNIKTIGLNLVEICKANLINVIGHIIVLQKK